jgi:hypothetical protein
MDPYRNDLLAQLTTSMLSRREFQHVAQQLAQAEVPPPAASGLVTFSDFKSIVLRHMRIKLHGDAGTLVLGVDHNDK